jgi:hypothetical protein
VSNFTALAVMLAIHLLTYIAYHVGDRWIHNRSEIVLHGVSSGVPISLRHRKMMLTNAFVPTTLSAMLLLVMMALGFVGLARNVSDGFVEAFALFGAFVYGVAALGLLAAAFLWFSYLRSVLRDAERLRQAKTD